LRCLEDWEEEDDDDDEPYGSNLFHAEMALAWLDSARRWCLSASRCNLDGPDDDEEGLPEGPPL